MKRIEFTLSMPNRGSWNGGWSGSDRNYSIVKSVTDKAASSLLGGKARESWGYNFGDGWFALVSARVVPAGKRLRKSDGFCGYDWMIRSILCDGEIFGPTHPKPPVAPSSPPSQSNRSTREESR